MSDRRDQTKLRMALFSGLFKRERALGMQCPMLLAYEQALISPMPPNDDSQYGGPAPMPVELDKVLAQPRRPSAFVEARKITERNK